MRPHTIALGMSGGVDSSVAAKLLIDQGHQVTGVYLECWRAPGCRTDQDRKDALSVALQLGIPFHVLDFKDAYREKVVEYFFREYEAGRTPNPDVLCNKEIKFGLFYDWARSNNFDAIATGHYAQTDGEHLLTSADTRKDQTYFLYRLTQEHLAHTYFPIGHLTKPQVRTLATQHHLPVADKKDSVGICFIGDINVHAFLKERLGEKPGPVVDGKGRLIGEHTGLWFYTVGQRHGFTVFPKTVTTSTTGETIDHHNIPPFYVIRKEPATNTLVVGFGAETYQREFRVDDVHWISSVGRPSAESTTKALPLLVRIRHTSELHRCTLDQHTHIVRLDEPIQGIAEGQSAVFYDQYHPYCLGGGIIQVV